jgi:hypothetical protein
MVSNSVVGFISKTRDVPSPITGRDFLVDGIILSNIWKFA